MTSKSKHQKPLKNLPVRPGEDRISNLPSCLIVKIISLLPTKDAVATSALSTKWKRLWTSVTDLDFNDTAMVSTASDKGFKRFVNRVLLLRDKTCLQRFHLKCQGFYDGSLVNAWIASVLPYNVQELDISIPVKRPVFLPSDLFVCNTLVILKLNARGRVNIPTSIHLPTLKTFHLDKVELSNDVSIVRLLSGCPVLEELRLSQCIGKDVRVVNITSPTLTTLTVEWLPYDGVKMPLTTMEYRVILDTPSLQYFNFTDYVAEGYAVKNMHGLVAAKISIEVSEDEVEELQNGMHTQALTDILDAISEVQSLGLSSRSIDAINCCSPMLPEFSSLTCMEITTPCQIGWEPLVTLLEKSPYLEILYLRQVPTEHHSYGHSDNCDVPSCFNSHLKMIKIDGFEWVELNIEMVEYILKKAKVLEKLTLRCQPCVNIRKKQAIFKELAMLPRGSTICKIEVV